MRKKWLGFILTICLTLLGVSCWLLVNPLTALAATCTATCEGGRTVTCRGESCTATDGVGCSGTINGIETRTPCPGRRPPIGE